MEGHSLSMIGEKGSPSTCQQVGQRKENKKVRPSRIVGPTLVVKDTDNYESTNGIEGHGGQI